MVLVMTDDDGLHCFNDIDSLLIDSDKRYRLRLEFCQPKPRMVLVVTNGEGWHRFGDTRGVGAAAGWGELWGSFGELEDAPWDTFAPPEPKAGRALADELLRGV